MNNKNKAILKGIISFIPIIKNKFQKTTGGSSSARYCYSVFLRHFVNLYKHKKLKFFDIFSEVGPGDSLGVGIASLLLGFKKYEALDTFRFANIKKNIEILDEIIYLFKNKSKIPNDTEFPRLYPKLENYNFPDQILNKNGLCFDAKKQSIIKQSIIDNANPKSLINYSISNDISKNLNFTESDMIISQAVLEHVNDLDSFYVFMKKKLKKNGIMSHVIDFQCHGTSDIWNGHWTYNEFVWKIIKGSRDYFLNREPISTHLNLHSKNNFIIFNKNIYKKKNNLPKKNLAKKFINFTYDDLNTSSLFIQSSRS